MKDHRDSRWLKFNDLSVTVAGWDELIKDSLGGGGSNASAYCLMYIDQKRKELLMGEMHFHFSLTLFYYHSHEICIDSVFILLPTDL